MKKTHEKQNIQVVCRFRPVIEWEKNKSLLCDKVHMVSNRKVVIDSRFEQFEYCFEKIFSDRSTQFEIYKNIAARVLNNIFSGYNCTLLCYGQTTSGKSYTLLNFPNKERKLYGITPRLVKSIFLRINKNQDPNVSYSVTISYYENYLQKITDLLDKRSKNESFMDKTLRKRKNLLVKEDCANNRFYVQGLTKHKVNNVREAFQLIRIGVARKKTCQSLINNYSSRSHSIIQLIVTKKNNSENTTITAKLSLVDLAGSERIYKTRNLRTLSGNIFDETKFINKSLSVLGKVICELNNKKKHVSFRESILTKLLKDSIGGNSKTTLLLTCSISNINISETIQTIRFGNVCKLIQNRVAKNISVNENDVLKQIIDNQKFVINKLQKELILLSKKKRVNVKKPKSSHRKTKLQNFELIEKINQKDGKIIELENKIYNLKRELFFSSEKKQNCEKKTKIKKRKTKLTKKQKRTTSTAPVSFSFTTGRKKKRKNRKKSQSTYTSPLKKEIEEKKYKKFHTVRINVESLNENKMLTKNSTLSEDKLYFTQKKKNNFFQNLSNLSSVSVDSIETISDTDSSDFSDFEHDPTFTQKCGNVNFLIGRSWKSRWVEKNKDSVKCYESIESLNITNEIKLKNVKIYNINNYQNEDICGFVIVDTENGREFIVKLNDQIERDCWMNAISDGYQ